jgi:hypothetical protein
MSLELPQDFEMILMIKEGTRGGISSMINRYFKASHEYVSDYGTKEGAILKRAPTLSSMWTLTTYMDGQCVRDCLFGNSSG